MRRYRCADKLGGHNFGVSILRSSTRKSFTQFEWMSPVRLACGGQLNLPERQVCLVGLVCTRSGSFYIEVDGPALVLAQTIFLADEFLPN
jgi:hypothetical protein